MKKIKIRDAEYENLEVVNVDVEGDGKNYTASISNIKETIKFLKEKKRIFLEQVDSEIDENQEILDSIKDDLKKVKIKKRKEEPFIPPGERVYTN